MTYKTKNFVLSLFFILFANSLAMVTYNVINFGAKADGVTNSAFAFEKAWSSACKSFAPAKVYVPQGTFLLHQTKFYGPCKNSYILFQIDGSVIAPFDYNVLKDARAWIHFQFVNAISIQGGLLDAKGSNLWKCKATAKYCPFGAPTLAFDESSNISITGLTSKDSELFHFVIDKSRNIKIKGVTIVAPENGPNLDGVHVEESIDVTIKDSNIGTGDDCISIGPGTQNLWIENINCGPGHGISIGSLAQEFNEEGVKNVTVKSVWFTNTMNGVRIKTWGRPSTSFVTNIIFQNITMNNVKNPIIIDQNYCPRYEGCPRKASGVKISNVNYLDIQGSSATEIAMNFNCSSQKPCTDIILEDINLSYKNQLPAKSWCANASGKCSGTVTPKSCFDEKK